MRVITTLLIFACLSLSVRGQNFTDVTNSAGITHLFDYGDFHFGGGAAIIDYNNDGFEDMYIVGGVNRDHFYQNNGNGTFTNIKNSAGLIETDTVVTIGVIAGDINNDGWTDLFITTRSDTSNINRWTRNLMYLNNGDGTFSNVSDTTETNHKASFSTSAAFGDYDNDGWIDLYVLNFLGAPIYSLLDSATASGIPGSPRPGSDNYLYHNNGDLTFTEVGLNSPVVDSGCGWANIFSDFDMDRDLDLYVANDFGSKTRPNSMYRNDFPVSGFADVSAISFTNAAINAMGVDAGDFNEDGWLDYYVTDLDTNVLYQNNGDGTFADVTVTTGTTNEGWSYPNGFRTSVGWGTNFFDFDHDSDLDLFVCNGALNPMTVRYNQADTFCNPNAMYANNGMGIFTDLAPQLGLDDPERGRGSVIFDYDNDGDMDILVVNQRHYQGYGTNASPATRLFRNDAANGNWLKVKLEGVLANRIGIGAMVEVHFNGRKLIREIHAGSSHLSSSSPIAHFGLDTTTMLDTVRVYWLNGNIDEMIAVPVNQQLNIRESQVVTGVDQKIVHDQNWKVYPNPTKEKLIIVNHEVTMSTNDLLEVFDIRGKRIIRQNGQGESQIELNVRKWKRGIYFYRISIAGEHQESGKFQVY